MLLSSAMLEENVKFRERMSLYFELNRLECTEALRRDATSRRLDRDVFLHHQLGFFSDVVEYPALT